MNVVRATQPIRPPEETYYLQVKPATEAGQLTVQINDEEPQIIEGFEFVAPLGTGLRVKRVMSVELIPEERFR